jgi:hypothetical protein
MKIIRRWKGVTSRETEKRGYEDIEVNKITGGVTEYQKKWRSHEDGCLLGCKSSL